MKVMVFAMMLMCALTAAADENGKLQIAPIACQGSVFSSIQKICSLVDGLGGAGCKITADNCATASQEVFTGSTIELASPTNIKPWNGMGGLGPHYTAASVCLMRDIAEQPEKKIKTSAKANTMLGSVTAEQEIGFLSFDKNTGTFEGYHRLKACGPAVGCLDAYTQKFKLTPVKTAKKGAGKTVGAYEIYESQGIDMWADGLIQGISVALPGIQVPTPIGDIEAKPEFSFGRATGFVVSPFDGNSKSSLPDAGLAISANKMQDVYGRTPGTDAMTVAPFDSLGDNRWKSSPKGWISQIALGSRNPNPKVGVWAQPAGVEYPARPDADIKVARSKAEKTPNAYLGASIKATYSPINLIPQPIRDIGCSGIVKLCIDQLEVFAKPMIDVGYASQFQFFHDEQSKWNGKLTGGTTGFPDLRPQNLDQAKFFSAGAWSSTAARFALEAGLDFVIRLEINTFFTKIKKDLVNIHPRTTIAEKVDAGDSNDNGTSKLMMARTQASQLMTDKKYFQTYKTVTGADLASGTTDGGAGHIKACFAKETSPGAMPPEPTYTPGNTSVLVEQIEYPCNVCVGWEATPYKDDDGKDLVVPGYMATLFPASQAAKPVGSQWKCKYTFQSGCYDMCKMDKDGKLTVTDTALEMLAAGKAKDMPATCARGR